MRATRCSNCFIGSFVTYSDVMKRLTSDSTVCLVWLSATGNFFISLLMSMFLRYALCPAEAPFDAPNYILTLEEV